ncbi:ATP-dependent helicase/nuclease subunit B [Mesorhizobium sp. BE184]|nr:ATP-dependent helicase/nuclease subunit B [Mesorhizobium sp. BE184]
MSAMDPGSSPRVFSIPPGVSFLSTLAEALLSGRLVPDFRYDGDPLALADATIYVPTRRAARTLRAIFTEVLGGNSAILPVIRPLGEFDEDEAAFETVESEEAAAINLAPPMASVERLLLLAPLVRLWKSRLPAEVAARFDEEVTVPASAADAIWLARDLAQLMDEVEMEGSDWARLAGLVDGNLAGWWQVTLDFLKIVTEFWPQILDERDRSNPAAHRSALIRMEAARLKRNPPKGPVIAAGSTGSIPATAELLAAISGLPRGAVVLPGLDQATDDISFAAITAPGAKPALLGHPQYGLAKLIGKMGILRQDVEEVGVPSSALSQRAALLSEALRPAETTDLWAQTRSRFSDADIDAALSGVTLVEAANERDEAAAVAIALRRAVGQPGRRAALVTGDRALARRVCAELLRFGIVADDSGGTPLADAPTAGLLRLILEAALRPGDPVVLLALIKHPLLALSLDRSLIRHASEIVELVALRGGTGRPDIVSLPELFEARLLRLRDEASRPPFWMPRLSTRRIEEARDLLRRLIAAVLPLTALRAKAETGIAELVRCSVVTLENLGRDADGSLASLYAGDAGDKLAEVLRQLVAADAPFAVKPDEWPDVMAALIAPEVVKPARGADRSVAIWGALEARLQSVDTLVIGGLNEGVWPRKPESDRFMSRLMKTGIDLEPPERRIGLAAHDFQMAMGIPEVVLARSARAGDAPAVPSRWLQRLLTFVGKQQADELRGRGEKLLAWARGLDAGERTDFAPWPQPKPPVSARPDHFSVTEIETLRRDPYAIYARKVLALSPLDPLIRDPGAAERGTLFHAILHRFSTAVPDPAAPDALEQLLAAGRACFAEAELPPDVEAVWWPRFAMLAGNIINWEQERPQGVTRRSAEERAQKTVVGESGVSLSGYADRIDLLAGGMADILDYKTGSSPSKAQAHTLLAPQLALEGALLKRGAFTALGAREPSQLAFVRLKPNGEVFEESILEYRNKPRSAAELAEEAWVRLEKLLLHYRNPEVGYLSRALPFREGEADGDYDHLARVLEWSAGGDDADGDDE